MQIKLASFWILTDTYELVVAVFWMFNIHCFSQEGVNPEKHSTGLPVGCARVVLVLEG